MGTAAMRLLAHAPPFPFSFALENERAQMRNQRRSQEPTLRCLKSANVGSNLGGEKYRVRVEIPVSGS